MFLTFEELEPSVKNVARKFSRKYGIEYEDFYQELWVWMIEKRPEQLALARTQLVNRAYDIVRNNIRKNGLSDSYDFSNQMSDNEIGNNSRLYNLNSDTNSDSNYMIDLVDVLESGKVKDRERVFIIVKGYLNGNISKFKDEYNRIFDELDDNEKEIIENYSKKDYTDDIVAKIFLHIKTGTNSGSMRTLKSNLKNIIDNLL